MKYRIVEFKVAQENTGFRFFVETGTVFRQSFMTFFSVKKTVWEPESGHVSFQDALNRIEQLKLMEPIFHEIK